MVQEWRTSGCRLPAKAAGPRPTDLSVNELLLAYYRFAEGHYVKDGRPTSEVSAPLQFIDGVAHGPRAAQAQIVHIEPQLAGASGARRGDDEFGYDMGPLREGRLGAREQGGGGGGD